MQGVTGLAEYAAVIVTPCGAFRLGIRISDDGLSQIHLLSPDIKIRKSNRNRELVDMIVTQLNDYFDDPCSIFSLPLALQGSVFQRRVWQALAAIPVGTTCTYGALAKNLGTSSRAIGGACRANPVPVVVPCHRVVAAHGVGGYAGHTSGPVLDVKNWLLNHESRL